MTSISCHIHNFHSAHNSHDNGPGWKHFLCCFFVYETKICMHFICCSLFFPLDYFHNTTISLCNYSACVTSSNLPLLFPNEVAGRHTSGRRAAGSGFASQLGAAASQVRMVPTERFLFWSREVFLCREVQSQLPSCAFSGHTPAEPAVGLCEGFSTSPPGLSPPAWF